MGIKGWVITAKDTDGDCYLLTTSNGVCTWFQDYVDTCVYVREYFKAVNNLSIVNIKMIRWARSLDLKTKQVCLHEPRQGVRDTSTIYSLHSKYGDCFGVKLSEGGKNILRDEEATPVSLVLMN